MFIFVCISVSRQTGFPFFDNKTINKQYIQKNSNKKIVGQQPYQILKHKTIIIKSGTEVSGKQWRFRNRSKYKQRCEIKGDCSNQWGKAGLFNKRYCHIWVTIRKK